MDEEILTALAHFQERIKEISLRFQELRDITYELYKENEELKEENDDLKKLLFEEKEGEESGEGYSNLLHLYNKGFHICHLSFGEKRNKDCLFCIQLIENKFAGQTED
ncbi:MAG: initiation control protein YabA [Halanaerobiaceae bacterium]